MTRGPPDTVAAAHVFVADVEAPVLGDTDRHHLERVLRVSPGTVVTVGDGAGRWRRVRFGPSLEPVGEVCEEPPAAPRITIAFALVKGERPELVVQKLTEMGVDRIVPFVAERCVVRWDTARAATHVARLRRVAREAAMQSRRAWLPLVEEVGTFATLASEAGACLAERGGRVLDLEGRTILVGPEGGWSAAEQASGLPLVSLGPHVLRAETASLVAGAVLTTLRGQLATEKTI